jgi:hypothetical protein
MTSDTSETLLLHRQTVDPLKDACAYTVPDLPREAVVCLERHQISRLHLQHRLQVRAERPDHLIAGQPTPQSFEPT